MVPSYQTYFPKACKSEEMVCSSSFSHVLSINTDGLKTQTEIAVFTDPWQRGCVSSVPLVLSLPHPSNRLQAERDKFLDPANRIESLCLDTYGTTRRWWFCVQTVMNSAGVIKRL